LALVVGALVGLLPLAVAVWLWRKLSHAQRLLRRRLLALTAGGMLLGLFAWYLERWLLAFAELPASLREVPQGTALLVILLVSAPLQEGLKVLALWPLLRLRQLTSARQGLLYALVVASGYASVDAAALVVTSDLGFTLVARALLMSVGQVFFAGVWGYALASGKQQGRWFALTWLSAAALHGLYDYLVLARGAGLLVLAVPLVLSMAVAAWAVLKDIAPELELSAAVGRFSLEPPSLEQVRGALRPPQQPLAFGWVALGTFTTFGLILSFLTAAVLLGRKLGVDFSLVDETELKASAPIALLGSAVLAAFPTAGLLLAHASGRFFEAALASALSIFVILLFLSAAAPSALVFTILVAPGAFATACAGAWLGVGFRR
jgi:hypothetical protein